MICVFREAYANCGYSPFLSFEVIDLQSRVQKLLELGAVLDGPIKYAERGKVTHYPGTLPCAQSHDVAVFQHA